MKNASVPMANLAEAGALNLSHFSKMRALVGAVVLLLLFGAMAAIHFGAVRLFVVVSDSMEPTLAVGDRILVDSAGRYQRFSVISFQDPTRRHDPDEQLVKRIIGLPGDTVEIDDGEVFVNGELQLSPNVTSDLINWPDTRMRVPIGHVFVLGDNRNNSFDSLNFGPVRESDISGVLTLILWPPARWGGIDPFVSTPAP